MICLYSFFCLLRFIPCGILCYTTLEQIGEVCLGRKSHKWYIDRLVHKTYT